MRHTKLVAAVFLASSVLMSSGAFAAEGDDPVVAKVGDAEIHESELTLAQGELDPLLTAQDVEDVVAFLMTLDTYPE